MKKLIHFADLKYKADWRTLIFLFSHFALLASQFLGFYRHPILIILLPFSCFIACIIVHNHTHCPTFKNDNTNSAFGVILSLAIGQPITGIITAHCTQHHGKNNQETDFVRCSLVKFSHNWLNLLTFPFISIYTMYKEKESDLVKWKAANLKIYKQAILERGSFYIFSIFLLIFDWQSTLLFLAIPWLLGQMMLVGINLLQHQDCDYESKYNHSRNIIGKMSNFIFFNNGFHTIHHLHPESHWSLTPQMHEEIKDKINQNLNYTSMTQNILERAVVIYYTNDLQKTRENEYDRG